MENTLSATEQDIVKRGWVFGHGDEFEGKRIYPSWSGALGGRRLVCRDTRIVQDGFVIHNPWTKSVDKHFATLDQLEAYIIENGRVAEPGANVWD